MRIALLFILVFWSDDSGYGLFQIFWILYPRPSSFNAQYLTPDTHLWCSASYTRYISSMLRILHQIHIFDAPHFISDTHLRCSAFYIRYTSLSTLDLALPSRALLHPIVYHNQSLQDVYPSSPVIIGLPAFGLCHLAITMAIQWRSWRLFIRGRGRLRPTGFSNSPPTVALKGGKSHALASGQFEDRLDNPSCLRISEWEYTFLVTYVLRWR